MRVVPDDYSALAQFVLNSFVFLGFVKSRMVTIVYECINWDVKRFQRFDGVTEQQFTEFCVLSLQEVTRFVIDVGTVIITFVSFSMVLHECRGQDTRS